MAFAQIKCNKNPGHQGRYRCGRFFDNGSTYRMEVLERALLAAEKETKHGNGPMLPGGALDMERIDRASLNRIKADPFFSVLEGGETDIGLSNDALEDARSALTVTQLALADEKAKSAGLEGESAKARNRIADLEAQLEEATKPDPKTKK